MIAQSGVPFELNYTAGDQATNLFPRASVIDITDGLPGVAVLDIPMVHTQFGVYVAVFTPVANTQYRIEKRVYTDGTYTTVATDRAVDVDEKECLNLAVNLSAITALLNQLLALSDSGIVGTLDTTNDIVGELDSEDDVVGVYICEED